MLVLTRKVNQRIQIGDDVEITILQVKGQSVRVGIEAPRTVRIVRTEIASQPPQATRVLVGAATPAEAPASEPSRRPGTGVKRVRNPGVDGASQPGEKLGGLHRFMRQRPSTSPRRSHT